MALDRLEHAWSDAQSRREGQAVDHIGIDVHRKESQICILAEEGEWLDHWGLLDGLGGPG